MASLFAISLPKSIKGVAGMEALTGVMTVMLQKIQITVP
jgi:hypothetical protein